METVVTADKTTGVMRSTDPVQDERQKRQDAINSFAVGDIVCSMRYLRTSIEVYRITGVSTIFLWVEEIGRIGDETFSDNEGEGGFSPHEVDDYCMRYVQKRRKDTFYTIDEVETKLIHELKDIHRLLQNVLVAQVQLAALK